MRKMSCCSSSPQIMTQQQDCYVTVTLVEQISVSNCPCWHHPPFGTAGKCLPEQGLCPQRPAVGPALQPAHHVLSSAHRGVQDHHVQWDRAALTEECRIAMSSGTEQRSPRSAGSPCPVGQSNAQRGVQDHCAGSTSCQLLHSRVRLMAVE